MSVRAPECVRHQRSLPRAGLSATGVAKREQRRREEERTGGGAVRGQNPRPPRGREGERHDPYSPNQGPPPPLSSGSAPHWSRPLLHPLPLIGCRSRPSSPPHWLLFHVILSGSFSIGVGHTLSFVTRLHLVSGLFPNHLSFIPHVVLGAWDMGVNQIRPCPEGVKGVVSDLGSDSDSLGW